MSSFDFRTPSGKRIKLKFEDNALVSDAKDIIVKKLHLQRDKFNLWLMGRKLSDTQRLSAIKIKAKAAIAIDVDLNDSPMEFIFPDGNSETLSVKPEIFGSLVTVENIINRISPLLNAKPANVMVFLRNSLLSTNFEIAEENDYVFVIKVRRTTVYHFKKIDGSTLTMEFASPPILQQIWETIGSECSVFYQRFLKNDDQLYLPDDQTAVIIPNMKTNNSQKYLVIPDFAPSFHIEFDEKTNVSKAHNFLSNLFEQKFDLIVNDYAEDHHFLLKDASFTRETIQNFRSVLHNLREALLNLSFGFKSFQNQPRDILAQIDAAMVVVLSRSELIIQTNAFRDLRSACLPQLHDLIKLMINETKQYDKEFSDFSDKYQKKSNNEKFEEFLEKYDYSKGKFCKEHLMLCNQTKSLCSIYRTINDFHPVKEIQLKSITNSQLN